MLFLHPVENICASNWIMKPQIFGVKIPKTFETYNTCLIVWNSYHTKTTRSIILIHLVYHILRYEINHYDLLYKNQPGSKQSLVETGDATQNPCEKHESKPLYRRVQSLILSRCSIHQTFRWYLKWSNPKHRAISAVWKSGLWIRKTKPPPK